MKTALLKLPFVVISLVMANLFTSCQEKEIAPVPVTADNMRLIKISGNNSLFVYNYNASGAITGIQHLQKLTNGTELNSSRVIFYNAQGVIDREENTTEFGLYTTVYKYTPGNVLYKTEEYLNNEKQSYTTYNYDAQGRLQVRTIFKQDDEIKEYREYQMYTYEYDSRDNLRMLVFYSKPNRTGPRVQVFYNKYEEYDNAFSIDNYISQPYIPGIKLHRNNPGKEYYYEGLSTTSPLVTAYYYTYNAQKLPVEKTTITATVTTITKYTYGTEIMQP